VPKERIRNGGLTAGRPPWVRRGARRARAMEQRANASWGGVRTTRVKSLLTHDRRRFARLWATAITPRGHVRGDTAPSGQRFQLRYHDGGWDLAMVGNPSDGGVTAAVGGKEGRRGRGMRIRTTWMLRSWTIS
jgi:hypothetical protein